MLELKIYENAHMVKLKGFSNVAKNHSNRSFIRSYSERSKKRLQIKLHQIDTAKIQGTPFFITLTYPADYSLFYADWKRHLDIFAKALFRRFRRSFFFWKLEFQKRGAPHFHLILFHTDKRSAHITTKQMIEFVSEAWFRAVNSGDEKHLKAGTNVQKVRSFKMLFAYVAKYVAKEETLQLERDKVLQTGRFWGIRNREFMPVTEIHVDLTEEQFFRLRRILSKWLEKKIKHKVKHRAKYAGIYIFVFTPQILNQILDYL